MVIIMLLLLELAPLSVLEGERVGVGAVLQQLRQGGFHALLRMNA